MRAFVRIINTVSKGEIFCKGVAPMIERHTKLINAIAAIVGGSGGIHLLKADLVQAAALLSAAEQKISAAKTG